MYNKVTKNKLSSAYVNILHSPNSSAKQQKLFQNSFYFQFFVLCGMAKIIQFYLIVFVSCVENCVKSI